MTGQIDQVLCSKILPEEIYHGLAGFRLAMRRFLAFSEAALADAGVTSQQYQALLVIKTAPNGKVVIRDLADQMIMHHNGAVQLLDRLCAAELAERSASRDDKRKVLICLTLKGREVLASLAEVHARGIMAHEPLLAESLSRLHQVADLA